MVNCFLLKLTKVKPFVRTVFVILIVVASFSSVDAFPLDPSSQQSMDLCAACNQEYNILTSPFDGKLISDRHWCAVFNQFERCVKPLEKICRTDLNFQGGISLLSHMKENRCKSMNLTWNETVDTIDDLKRMVFQVDPEPPVCGRPKYEPKYKICGLFGDPHLRTFDDNRHTCSVPGAWPLFANRHLTVQVTNIPLHNGSRATATSKVTVIVKEYKRKCIKEKTYQAKSFSLPAVFTDGTKSSSDDDCPTRIRQLVKGRLVQLDICRLKTRIIIRQVGKYLTVHLRVPQALMRRKTIGLCQRGCPRIERMNLDKVPRLNSLITSHTKDILSKRVKRQRHSRARRLCRAAKLTGFYYKSCIFDLMMSDDSSFVRAARTAMKDFRTINVDDHGKPIVNETARDFYIEPTNCEGVLSWARTTPEIRPPSSSCSAIQQTSLLLSLSMLLVLWRIVH